MPLKALLELGKTEVFCLIATEDDAFTFNDKVNGLSRIQEHGMIMQAIKRGVTAEQIAKALAVDVGKIKASMNLLDGIHADTLALLKDKPISMAAHARGARSSRATSVAHARSYNRDQAERSVFGAARQSKRRLPRTS